MEEIVAQKPKSALQEKMKQSQQSATIAAAGLAQLDVAGSGALNAPTKSIIANKDPRKNINRMHPGATGAGAK